MKTAKKFASLLLALTMVFAMMTTAFAAEDKGTIIVDNPVANQTYTAYKIFDVTYDSTKTNYSYTIKTTSEWYSTVKAYAETGGNGLTLTGVAGDTTTFVVSTTDAFSAPAFANALKAAMSGKTGTTLTADGTTVKATNLDLGYYFVTSTNGALCNLTTTNPSVTIHDKNDIPFNKVDDKESVDVGEIVTYTITGKVPDYTGFKTYTYEITDTMSEGLTFNESSVKVTVGSTTLVKGTDYTVVTSGLNDGCTFEVHFTDEVLKPNDVAVVSYTATINDKAVIGGAGNKNTTHLDYINNGTVTHSPASETTTYVWKMSVLKYAVKDNEEIPLAGAQFKLYKMENSTEKYAVVDNSNRLTSWTDTESNASVFTTPAEGKFNVYGLDAGTYYLKEIVAPAGYNLLANPIEVTISTTTTNDALTSSVTYKVNDTSVTANPDVKVLNQTGALLPETGGVGTTVFYLVGSLLVLVAVVLLVTRKKMSAGK